MKNEIVTTRNDRSLDGAAREALELALALEALGVNKAETERGQRYVRDPESGDFVVAAPGVIVQKANAMLGVAVVLPGAKREEVLAGLSAFTQDVRGAVVGRCQSWVSQREAQTKRLK